MRIRRFAIVGVVVASLFFGPFAGVALAHVEVIAEGAAQGGSAELSFEVPNEKDNPTVKVEIALPRDTPILAVTVPPMEGWSYSTVTEAPETPIVGADGQPVSEVVSRVIWTATGAGVPPEESGEFVIDAGVLPTVDHIVFKALQTYRDASVVSWIQPAVDGAPEPDLPAPVLALAPADAAAAAPGAPPSSHRDEAMSNAEMSTVAAGSVQASAPAAPTAVSSSAGSATSSGVAVPSGVAVSAAEPTQAADTTSTSNTGPVVIVAVIVVLVLAGGGYALLRSRRSNS
jgi:uncharacterized protein YcnI